MNCLCCGKPLPASGGVSGWHKSCIRRFFGTGQIPKIQIDDETLELLAEESTNRGFTVPGVQKKLSLHLMNEGDQPRLTLVNYPTGYILKPQVEEFEALPESEQLVMCMADAAGLSTVPHALVRGNGGPAYITKRIDRVFSAGKDVRLLAMEDFCQLDLRLTQDKYKGSYERCARIIRRYSHRSGLDMSEFYLRLVFCFLVGNSDMHLKNFSLIETAEGSGEYVLSPAYDLLPVNVMMPEDREQFALSMNGKKTNLHRKDFLLFADTCEISRRSAQKMIAKVTGMEPTFLSMCETSLLPEYLRTSFAELIHARAAVLNGSPD